MANTNNAQSAQEVQTAEADSESDDDEVIETSPCGRWEKHKKEFGVPRNVPGIDSSFLAMDTEEGVEVVWNEVMFSERKSWKNKEEMFKRIFENLTQLNHPNIVKFHKYWVDLKGEQPRLVFISEYMTSGSLSQFLKKTKANKKYFNIKAWKRWCQQILSALSYLHDCDPPVIHGNLNCDTIHIQHNGLMKIGTVAPDAIHNYVKTFKHQQRNMHFIAPEYGVPGRADNCAADVYSFGVVALEMATLEWSERAANVTTEMISTAIEVLEDSSQKEFIDKCLRKNPSDRPTVRELLLQPVLLEVYSLKILAGHALAEFDYVKSLEEIVEREPEKLMAEVVFQGDKDNLQWKYNQVQPLEFEKFLEEIKTGLYPLTGMESSKPKKEQRPVLNTHSRPKSPEDIANSSQGSEEEDHKPETRSIVQMTCSVKIVDDIFHLTLIVRFDDKMNRQLTCKVGDGETSQDLANELVKYGLVNEADRDKVADKIEENIRAS